ncbi:MAG: hypothetical protein K0Q79_2819 [Flavipsychrobacter sp.]|jgi:N-acetylmuramoyl-L-alanine amidase|nr:hypothetical protein [Flavipsychrobacter sp.]
MSALLLFLVKNLVVSGLLFAWYWFGLRKTKLYQYNRAFLLFALYASIQVPLLHFQWFDISSMHPAINGDAPVFLQIVTGEYDIQPGSSAPVSSYNLQWNIVLLCAMLLVSAFLIVRLALNVIHVIRAVKHSSSSYKDGVCVVHTDQESAPFSFFNYLFWNNAIDINTPNGELVFKHELAHIKQRHSLDKLVSQAVSCILWINPFYWLIRKELELTHEFIADEQAITGNDTEAFAKMLLTTRNYTTLLSPQHSFFSSSIKMRLTMLQKTYKTRYARLRRLAVLPIVAILLMTFSVTAGSKHAAAPSAKKIVLVVDPGHGGNDVGCSNDALTEKALVLKISNRIKEMGANYNVEVHLTRNNDNHITLADRVAAANKIHPDAFISIHVGNDRNVDVHAGDFGMGIAIADGNIQKDKSIVLGKSVYTQIVQSGGVRKNDKAYNTEKGLYVCKNSKAPSILIELGDIKSKSDMARLTNNAQLDELCEAILNGVVLAQK